MKEKVKVCQQQQQKPKSQKANVNSELAGNQKLHSPKVQPLTASKKKGHFNGKLVHLVHDPVHGGVYLVKEEEEEGDSY